jgi:putative transposase
MIEQFDLSERHACGLVGLSRDSYRHPPVPDEATVALSTAIIDIAQARRRFGYRRIHDLLRPEFPNVNHKRMYRLYSVAKLAVQSMRSALPH